MASTFSFGFSGDDIDMDVDHDTEIEAENSVFEEPNTENANAPNASFPTTRHLLKDWTTNLPSQISYNTLKLGISEPTNYQNENNKKTTTIARRELFDVRTQLMAEDDAEDLASDNAELIAGLEQGDLKPNFYEGGFKTWECSLDLADVLLGSSETSLVGEEGVHVIELGCGTAVPSLMLFAQILLSSSTDCQEQGQGQGKRRYRFTMADYNSTVLRMVTFSNFLLTWWINSASSPRASTIVEEAVDGTEEEGELDIDATLLDTFQTDLANRGIEIDFISGGWSAEFVQLALSPDEESQHEYSTLILASETIYSPSSLGVFSETLLELLRKSAGAEGENKSTALIAAKKVYFGVGGGVDEFLQVLDQQPLQDKESVRVQERGEITSGGVKRVVLEIGIDRK